MNNVIPHTIRLKEKLKIAGRIIFALALGVMIAWEFMQPNENRFRSWVRIAIWLTFLIMQIDVLIKKFRDPKPAKES